MQAGRQRWRAGDWLGRGERSVTSCQSNPRLRQQAGFIVGGLAAALRFSSRATRWFGSQNCLARWSAILPRALLLGEVKSVGKIGSQTTRTRSFVSEWLARNFSAAEAPRRHVAQVGESKRMMRG